MTPEYLLILQLKIWFTDALVFYVVYTIESAYNQHD